MLRTEEKVSDTGRCTVYDWLRLIATIFVVVGHSAYLSIQTSYGGVSYELPENLSVMYNTPILTWIRNISGWVYGFHMPLFFMLSGAVLALKPLSGFDKVVKSKVKRLLIPYFVYGWLFMFPVKRLGNFYDNSSVRLALKGFLSGADSGHLWFLTALFWCIIIFVAMVKLLNKIGIKSIYALFFLSGIVYFTYSYLPFDVLGIKTGLSYLIYFCIGYIFEIERKKNEKWNMKKTVLAYIILLILEILHFKYDILNLFFLIIAGSFMTYLLADILDRIFVHVSEKKWWKVVTRNLFYIYLFHDPMNYLVLRFFMGRRLLETGFGCVMFTISRTCIIFIVSMILGEIVSYMKKKIVCVLN